MGKVEGGGHPTSRSPVGTPQAEEPAIMTCPVDCTDTVDFDGDLDVDLSDVAEVMVEFDGGRSG